MYKYSEYLIIYHQGITHDLILNSGPDFPVILGLKNKKNVRFV